VFFQIPSLLLEDTLSSQAILNLDRFASITESDDDVFFCALHGRSRFLLSGTAFSTGLLIGLMILMRMIKVMHDTAMRKNMQLLLLLVRRRRGSDCDTNIESALFPNTEVVFENPSMCDLLLLSYIFVPNKIESYLRCSVQTS